MTHPFSPLTMRGDVRPLRVDVADDAVRGATRRGRHRGSDGLAPAPPAFRAVAGAALVMVGFVKRIVTV